MKKLLALILALALCLSLCACGSGAQNDAAAQDSSTELAGETTPEPTPEPEPKYAIGDTVSTDLVTLTLDASEPAVALSNEWGMSGSDEWGNIVYTPKEYDASKDANNPFVAGKGHTLIYFCITMTNQDRTRLEYASSSSDLSRYYTIEYNGNTTAELKTGAMISNVAHYVGNSRGGATKIEPNSWFDSTILSLEPGETATARLYFVIPVNPEELTEGYTLSFELPNSDGSKTTFSFYVPAK